MLTDRFHGSNALFRDADDLTKWIGIMIDKLPNVTSVSFSRWNHERRPSRRLPYRRPMRVLPYFPVAGLVTLFQRLHSRLRVFRFEDCFVSASGPTDDFGSLAQSLASMTTLEQISMRSITWTKMRPEGDPENCILPDEVLTSLLNLKSLRNIDLASGHQYNDTSSLGKILDEVLPTNYTLEHLNLNGPDGRPLLLLPSTRFWLHLNRLGRSSLQKDPNHSRWRTALVQSNSDVSTVFFLLSSNLSHYLPYLLKAADTIALTQLVHESATETKNKKTKLR